jgi:hypothetical protein
LVGGTCRTHRGRYSGRSYYFQRTLLENSGWTRHDLTGGVTHSWFTVESTVKDTIVTFLCDIIVGLDTSIPTHWKVASISDSITITVCLVWVESEFTVIAGVSDAIFISISLIRVSDKGAVVTGISKTVMIRV